MSIQKLSSRAIIGEFYRILNTDPGTSWVAGVSQGTPFQSDQASEEYGWLGQVPTLREWTGGRQAKGLRDESYVIKNVHYEASIEILVRWLRRDKTGQAMIRIRELAQRANTHWATLLSTLIRDGESNTCYDGQYFFDTDHQEGDSGVQSNSVQVDISALSSTLHGTPTAPSVSEMQQAILQGVTQIQTFVDDQGEPMNENVTDYLVMVPPSMSFVAMNALSVQRGTDLTEVLADNFSIRAVPNVRLGSWTDKFALFALDTNTGAIIRQEETNVMLKAKAEGSEYEYDHDAHQYGIDTWRSAGYGMWQDACLVTMV